jgi:hypothetical protein
MNQTSPEFGTTANAEAPLVVALVGPDSERQDRARPGAC